MKVLARARVWGIHCRRSYLLPSSRQPRIHPWSTWSLQSSTSSPLPCRPQILHPLLPSLLQCLSLLSYQSQSPFLPCHSQSPFLPCHSQSPFLPCHYHYHLSGKHIGCCILLVDLHSSRLS